MYSIWTIRLTPPPPPSLKKACENRSKRNTLKIGNFRPLLLVETAFYSTPFKTSHITYTSALFSVLSFFSLYVLHRKCMETKRKQAQGQRANSTKSCSNSRLMNSHWVKGLFAENVFMLFTNQLRRSVVFIHKASCNF